MGLRTIRIKLIKQNKTMLDLAKFLKMSPNTLYRRAKKWDWREWELEKLKEWDIV